MLLKELIYLDYNNMNFKINKIDLFKFKKKH